MTEATKVPPVTSPAGFWMWQVPGTPVTVRLHLDLLDRLRQELMYASAQQTRDIRGVLLGQFLEGSRPMVLVEDFELVREDTDDSDLRLGEDDCFANVAQRWLVNDHTSYGIGFFRSQRSAKPLLRKEDRAMSRRWFPFSYNVGLLIRYSSKGQHAGTLFCWEAQDQKATCIQFPLIAETSSLAIEPGERNHQLPKGEEAVPAFVPASRARRFGLLIMLCIVFVLSIMSAVLWKRAPKRAIKPAPEVVLSRSTGIRATGPLELETRWNGEVLNVSWNGDSPVVIAAEKGILSIRDGARTHELRLDRNQLREGHLYFAPFAPDIGVRLEVAGMNGTVVSEAVTAPIRFGALPLGSNVSPGGLPVQPFQQPKR